MHNANNATRYVYNVPFPSPRPRVNEIRVRREHISAAVVASKSMYSVIWYFCRHFSTLLNGVHFRSTSVNECTWVELVSFGGDLCVRKYLFYCIRFSCFDSLANLDFRKGKSIVMNVDGTRTLRTIIKGMVVVSEYIIRFHSEKENESGV